MAELNLPHRVRLPDSTTSPAPAVVMVHGWLGDENVMWIFENTLPKSVVAVSPRAPFFIDEAQKGFGWYLNRKDSESFRQGLNALHDFVTGLPAAYPVHPARIVLMGFSQGAAMCYALMLEHPEATAAVAGLAGFIPEAATPWLAPGRLSGKSVFIAHGLEDETVSIEEAARAREALSQCGADVEYHEYAAGHKLSAQGMRDLKAWLAREVG
jgi:phospholipase/carboxylesterase